MGANPFLQLGSREPACWFDQGSFPMDPLRFNRIEPRRFYRQVKREGRRVRILAWQLPIKAPWLNPIEPKWVHGKRAVSEPARLLAAAELEERVCQYFGCQS